MKPTFIISLIFIVILICGCVSNNKISDDEQYLKNLDDYFSQYSQTVQNDKSSSMEKYAADTKILSVTYYNRMVMLNVSPQFELSKNSFLQSMKEMEAISDIMLSPAYKKMTDHDNIEQISPAEINQAREFSQHDQNIQLYWLKTFDSNVCSAANGKYANVTLLCESFSKISK